MHLRWVTRQVVTNKQEVSFTHSNGMKDSGYEYDFEDETVLQYMSQDTRGEWIDVPEEVVNTHTDALAVAVGEQADLYEQASKHTDALGAALEAVLNSDMAQREEDEGEVSEVLNQARAALEAWRLGR